MAGRMAHALKIGSQDCAGWVAVGSPLHQTSVARWIVWVLRFSVMPFRDHEPFRRTRSEQFRNHERFRDHKRFAVVRALSHPYPEDSHSHSSSPHHGLSVTSYVYCGVMKFLQKALMACRTEPRTVCTSACCVQLRICSRLGCNASLLGTK